MKDKREARKSYKAKGRQLKEKEDNGRGRNKTSGRKFKAGRR